jgi:C1A family cysteine protease
VTEEQKRRKIYDSNLNFIKLHNENNEASSTLSLNCFSDLTHFEFMEQKSGHQPIAEISAKTIRNRIKLFNRNSFTYPKTLDYQKMGIVTSVKDQGMCGACYSFAGNILDKKFNVSMKLILNH